MRLRSCITNLFTASGFVPQIWILTQYSLDLAHNLVVGDCFPTLVVGDDLRLLVNFLSSRERHGS